MNAEKILVTGGAGYIGSILVPKLIQNGYKVSVLDSLVFNQSSLLDCCNSPNFEFILGDICNHSLVNNLINKFDIIYNFAAQAGVRYSFINPKQYLESNVVGFFNIL